MEDIFQGLVWHSQQLLRYQQVPCAPIHMIVNIVALLYAEEKVTLHEKNGKGGRNKIMWSKHQGASYKIQI